MSPIFFINVFYLVLFFIHVWVDDVIEKKKPLSGKWKSGEVSKCTQAVHISTYEYPLLFLLSTSFQEVLNSMMDCHLFLYFIYSMHLIFFNLIESQIKKAIFHVIVKYNDT